MFIYILRQISCQMIFKDSHNNILLLLSISICVCSLYQIVLLDF